MTAIECISWNVNGLRAVLGKGLDVFIKQWAADIVMFQEIKAQQHQIADMAWADGYHTFWNPAQKPGYSGTMTLSRIKPIEVSLGLPNLLDTEGRVLTLEFPHCFVVNVYTPNSQNELARLPYRVDTWDPAFRAYVAGLATKKHVLVAGDLNVAHTEIDLANPKTNTKNAGFTPQERDSFSQLLAAGFVDSFRHFCKEPKQYTWWNVRTGARARNVGWRIDYFCVSQSVVPHMQEARILPEVMGSDHCPVTLKVAPKLFLG